MSMQEFLHMGGYGFYVWTSYGLWALVMVLNLYFSRTREKKIYQQLRQRIQS